LDDPYSYYLLMRVMRKNYIPIPVMATSAKCDEILYKRSL